MTLVLSTPTKRSTPTTTTAQVAAEFNSEVASWVQATLADQYAIPGPIGVRWFGHSRGEETVFVQLAVHPSWKDPVETMLKAGPILAPNSPFSSIAHNWVSGGGERVFRAVNVPDGMETELFAEILRGKGYANIRVDYVLVEGIQKMGTLRLTLPVSAGLPPASVLIHTKGGPTYTVRIDGLSPTQAAAPESAFRPPPKLPTPGSYAAAASAPKAAAVPQRTPAPAASPQAAPPKAAAAQQPLAAEDAAAEAQQQARHDVAVAALVLEDEKREGRDALHETVCEASARLDLEGNAYYASRTLLREQEEELAELTAERERLQRAAMAAGKGTKKRKTLLATVKTLEAEQIAPALLERDRAAAEFQRRELRYTRAEDALRKALEAEVAAAGDPPDSGGESAPPSPPPGPAPPVHTQAESPLPAATKPPVPGTGDAATPVLAVAAGPPGPAAPQPERNTPSVTPPDSRPRPMDEGEDRRPEPDNPQPGKKARPEEAGGTTNAAQA
jgi:hypothetical protein